MKDKSAVRITLIGGPTAVIEYCGMRFLTDPTFDDGGSAYNLGTITLKKKTSPARPPDSIGHIDAVLLSHDQHSDNLDTSGRDFLQKADTVLTTPEGANRLKNNARGLSCWQKISLKSPSGALIDVTATPCRHGPAGIEPISGPVTGFMVESQDGSCMPLYITGDTVYFEGVADVARRFLPQCIVAFAGAARTRGPFNLTMSTNDLLDTAQAFPQALIIPIHTEGWEHFTLSIEDIKSSFAALHLSHRLRMISPGETVEISNG